MCTPLIPALGRQRQRQGDPCEFQDSLVYRMSFKTARATQRDPVSKNKQTKDKKRERKGYVYFLNNEILVNKWAAVSCLEKHYCHR